MLINRPNCDPDETKPPRQGEQSVSQANLTPGMLVRQRYGLFGARSLDFF